MKNFYVKGDVRWGPEEFDKNTPSPFPDPVRRFDLLSKFRKVHQITISQCNGEGVSPSNSAHVSFSTMEDGVEMAMHGE